MSAYSKLKLFHYHEKLDSIEYGNITPPLHVRLKPTNVCNHRCSYCCYRQPDLQLGQAMDVRDFIPRDKMREIVEDLISMNVKAVTFSGGGEPFVYPYLLETVKALQAGGIKFASLTNGARLSGEVGEFFARYGSWVRVSIDGWDGPSYARYRGVGEGEFDKVMCNLAAFSALGGPCKLSACINVDATNAMHIHELITRLVQHGQVKTIKVTPIVYSNDGQENYEYHAGLVNSVKVQVAYSQRDFPGVEIWNDYTASLTSYAKPYTWCPYLQIRPAIGADQWVYSCVDHAYTEVGKLFSIKDQSFQAGWMKGDWAKRINPNKDCTCHCVADGTNRMLHEYLDVDDRDFV